ncbi:hypothetical protein Lal_00040422 [Lupinus albus]|uniref:Putative glycerophosphodiester phosphodiesterase, protein kinase RLK-Pelle-LRK10L-2 family n=1 Tax=Lupinus albus TaxID=3870 RepID=A0A6A5MSB1_LUPAL|nr:putative glycerophosphodiester phosphodiesterase, protein kinase RLK-Pelle-LRK10L-2 family [Lupinus albus]KAF1877704.1 hypothetical protein Lal_00040422 [Lupinus albus]
MVKKTSNFLCKLSIIISTILLLFQLTHSTNHHQPCPPSSCGKVHNITYPFKLKTDPINCGDPRYELECTNNNSTLLLSLFSAKKYHVQHIDYNTYKIILTDPGVVEDATCSFIPRYFLSETSFKPIFGPDDFGSEPFTLYHIDPYRVAYFNCTNPVITNDAYGPKYVKVDTSNCTEYGTNGHVYAVMETRLFGYSVSDIRVGCSLMVATLTGTRLSEIGNGNVSYDEIRRVVGEGFVVSWLPIVCEDECGKGVDCEVVDEISGQVKCDKRYCHYAYHTTRKCGILYQIIGYTTAYLRGIVIGIYSRISFSTRLLDNPVGLQYFDGGVYIGRNIISSLFAIRILFGVAFLILLLIYKWRRRHLSIYEGIESFLLDNNFNPIRYDYKEIKKMSGGFKVKLGQGGFGSVYKGKLRSGVDVAIKMLSKFNPNGQDFINEVATIGRIHHVNVVHLVGYCVDGKKRALVYDFMPNGSLDKYIFSKEESSVHLSYAKIYEISLGIAHGIEYLHQGCDMQILHFDIKPHNILLDENFIPKVSDFGLARLYPLDCSIAPLTVARGTLGYMAPELFYNNIGGLSYKVDVYSFGMLLMEMTSKRKNSNPHAEHSSQTYFPFWIHDQFLEEKDIEIENGSDEDNGVAKKMFIVALWCIQLKPSDRPSMSKVVEMLEGKIESLEIPPRPSYYPQERFQHDEDDFISHQTSWSDSSSFDHHHGQIITTHQENSVREIET